MAATLGKYLLFDRLNEGGMAEVYLAKAFGFEGANQILVLKCIRPDRSLEPPFIAMFVEEAKLSALLSHQNIARTYELGRVGTRYFIAMEYVPGRDLRALLDRLRTRGQVLPEDLALYIVAQACDGLDYAHRKTGPRGDPLQIVHRDVSPPNILVGYDGQVKLIDFGVAKVAARATERSRVLKGKYAYMSPEQARGLPVDARSDVFAAGAVLFELLTSCRLFTGRSELSVLDKVRFAEVYPPRLALPSVTPESEAIVLRALAAEVERRFQSAGEMRDAIVGILLQRRAAAAERTLAALMTDLFADEAQRERERLAKLRSLEMPPDAPALDDVISGAELPSPSAETYVGAGPPNEPEQTDPEAYAPAAERLSNGVIFAAAVLIAALLVLTAYLVT